jgi:PAS domain S-box-containing protein
VDARRVLHELEVHQAELEIQNEELRGARGELELALARFTELFDFAPIGYATLSADGVVGALNHAGARLLGKPRARVAGAPLELFVAAHDRAAFRALLQRVLEGEVGASCELELALPGRSLKVHVTASAVVRAEQPILVAFQDVTERLAREAQLARAEQALREASRRKDDFLAMLSHELRNPLGAIVTATSMMKSDGSGLLKRDRLLDILDRQSQQMAHLLDDLLEASRVTQNKIELRRRIVDLRAVARDAADAIRGQMDDRGVAFALELPDDPVVVDGDPARLQQIQVNLLNNAAKYTPRGGHVALTVGREDADAVVRVRDDGVGIPPQALDSVFDLFVQSSHTLDRAAGGLGLGLTLVRSLVAMHGGTVTGHSDGEGQGSEFVVRLPLAPPGATVAVMPRRRNVVLGERAKVMIVEDNTDSRELLCELLEQAGFECRAAATGAAALEVIEDFRPDVAVLDLGLPGMDGFELARHIRGDARAGTMILIALTGYGQAADRAAAREAGFDEHLVKPVQGEQLLSLLGSMRGRRAAS